jgi:hypothetical protein
MGFIHIPPEKVYSRKNTILIHVPNELLTRLMKFYKISMFRVHEVDSESCLF